MKKITVYAAAAFMFAACQNNSYKITGTADESTGDNTVYLVGSNNEVADSAIISNGSFTFEGESAEPDIYRIQLGRRSNIVFVEPGRTINIDFTADNIPVTDNGGANDIKTAFTEQLNSFLAEKNSTYNKMQQDGKPQEEIEAYAKKAGEEMTQLYKNIINDNKDNIFGAFMLANIARNTYTDLEQFDSVMNAVKYSGRIDELQRIRTSIEYKDATKEGKPFVDFKGKDIEGKETALSNYVGKGKYVLVDFWASWCGPCRGEIPNLLAVNKEFGGENFEVLGVNVWDQEQKFKESLKKEGIDYTQIYIPGDGNATELYGINGIPQIMLIGPDGTILKRDLRGEDIKKAVAEALGK